VIDDPEIRAMFAGELAERAGRLVGAAQLARSGTATAGDLDLLLREAHTIKGTGRMMGCLAVGEAARVVEQAAERLDEPAVAAAVERIGSRLVETAIADPAAPEIGLDQAVESLRAMLEGRPDPDAPDSLPTPPAVVPPPPEPRPVPYLTGAASGLPGVPIPGPDSNELGGLLSTLDSWAFGETVRVDSASLFRLINTICSLRVDTEVLETLVLTATAAEEPSPELLARLRDEVLRAGRDADAVQRQALELAAAPVSEITATCPQLVRYLARKTGKEVRFELVGDESRADRQVLERLSDPLRQLLVNAVQHGLETPEERIAAGKPRTGLVSVRALVKESTLEIVVEDDGRGVDWDEVHRVASARQLVGERSPVDPSLLQPLLFAAGLGTADASDLIWGEGSGLAAVTAAVEDLHGNMSLETTPGEGTRVRLVVPVSRSLQDAVIVGAGGHQWGISEAVIHDALSIERVRIEGSGERARLEWEGMAIPVYSLAAALGLNPTEDPRAVLVVSSRSGRVGFTVERLLGSRQIAVRELGPLLGGLPHVTGAALLGGGDVIVLVDPGRLAESAFAAGRAGPRHRVLVVDDSLGVRQVVGSALGSAGFDVSLAATAAEGLDHLGHSPVDAVLVDFVLPDMDGVTLVEMIRSRGVGVPIVMLSGMATRRDQERALLAGADMYLDKDDMRHGALAETLRDLMVTFSEAV